jgi:subfamily B ATP-binding cassette protein MsbA
MATPPANDAVSPRCTARRQGRFRIQISLGEAPRRKTIKRLLQEARPYYPRFILSMLFGVIAGLGPLSYTYALKLIGDDVLPNKAGAAQLLWLIVIGLFVINLIASAASYGQNYLTAWSGQRLIANLRVRLFARVMHLPLGEFDKWRPGEFLARFTNDLGLMTDSVSIALPQLVQTMITFIGALAIMFYRDWLLTLFLILFTPVVNYAVAAFTRLISAGTRRAQDRIADMASNLAESVQGERIIKAFGREDFEVGRFRNNNERYFDAYMKLTQFGQTQTPVVGTIIQVAMLAILVFSAREVMVHRMAAGDMLQFVAALVLAINPINRFATYIGDLSKGLVGANRVFEILDLPVERDDAQDAIEPASIAGAVAFENVTFSYGAGAPPVLHDLSGEIEAGEIVALVGPSGAGKTTIVNLVPRFYEPGAGRITLDGIDIARIKLSVLRSAIAIVPQEALLFSGTVGENIRYGRLDATQAEIEMAAREANAEEFILDLPRGYDTAVGERGVRLSGGQRQRISIARAVLRDPRILILDEATSALDSHSERLIEAALDQFLPGRTTLIIAHRLSTIRRAHKIFYIEAGRVVEVGSHQDLIARGGPYSRLHAAQFAL